MSEDVSGNIFRQYRRNRFLTGLLMGCRSIPMLLNVQKSLEFHIALLKELNTLGLCLLPVLFSLSFSHPAAIYYRLIKLVSF